MTGGRRARIGVLALALGGHVAAAPAAAQMHASERSTLTQQIGGTVVTIDYSRPSIRDRDSIFGKVVTWGEVWTPGANKATTLALSNGVRLNGQEIPAGTYSVWLQAAAEGDWTLYLNRDTTLFHVPHPTVDSMAFAIPVTPQATADPRETLTWDIQRIRATSAQLQLQWDRTLVSLELGVDGLPTTVAAAVGRLYEGAWVLAWGPADSTATADTSSMQHITLHYDEATQQLLGAFEGEGESDESGTWGMVLIPRAEGIFMAGYTLNGELVEADPDYLYEFAFDGGRPVSFVGRGPDDEVFARGRRAPG